MSVEKSLYAAPEGLEQLGMMGEEPTIEIEMEGDESLEEEQAEADEQAETEEFNKNLAEDMSEEDLSTIAGDLVAEYDEDVGSRKEWIQTYVDGLELLGMKIEERTDPWEGACGVTHPLLAEALVKFQAETMMSTFPAAGPVKTTIIGRETPDKKDSAKRVQDDMNHQLTDVMTEYRPEHERMLWGLGLAGNAFKKVYYDPNIGRQVSIFVPAEDIVVPYGASDLASSPRVTHVMRKGENEVRKLQVAGFWRDVELGAPTTTLDEIEKKIAEKLGFRATADDRFKILEMQVELDLKGYEDTNDKGEPTGIALPYIVTIEKGTNTVLAIRRNWNPDDENFRRRAHIVHYGYIPGFGFYCFGLIHLIGAYAKSGTSLLRQLVDSGTLSNLPGGFKTRGMRIKGDDGPIGPGEWRDVDVPSGTLRDNLMPLPYKEPSQSLAGLMDKIIEEGRRFANSADLQISDMSGQAPVGTTLAILERTMKTMSAVQARVHYSMKQELRLLKEIIADYTPDDYAYDPDVGDRRAKKSDYDNVDVIPVSDPNASTMAQKIVQYQAVFQMAQANPALFNMPLLNRQMLEVMGIKDAAALVPMDDNMKATDPVTENQNVLMMMPVKAFLTQDHQAHIMVHMAAMKDPKIQALLAENPQAPMMMQAMQAHINEHLGFEYRRQIEQQLGMNLPPQTDESGAPTEMSPEVEARLSPLLAQAAQRLLQQNTQQKQQAEAAQQAQDPIVQMQQQELQIKAADQQRKAQKDQADAVLKAQQIKVEQERIAAQKEIAASQQRTDLLKTAAMMTKDREMATANTAVDVLKHLSNKSAEEQLRAMQERIQTRQQQQRQQTPPKKGE